MKVREVDEMEVPGMTVRRKVPGWMVSSYERRAKDLSEEHEAVVHALLVEKATQAVAAKKLGLSVSKVGLLWREVCALIEADSDRAWQARTF